MKPITPLWLVAERGKRFIGFREVPGDSLGNPAEIRPLRDDPGRCRGKIVAAQSVIPKSRYRFSEKIMLKQKDRA
jgi:hypothetical protein